jgi:uncharacterized protein YuzE
MNSPRLSYFEKEDILHLAISEEPEAGSVEVSPNITAELNDQGRLIGIEILRASAFIRDSILETVQGRLLELPRPNPRNPAQRHLRIGGQILPARIFCAVPRGQSDHQGRMQ